MLVWPTLADWAGFTHGSVVSLKVSPSLASLGCCWLSQLSSPPCVSSSLLTQCSGGGDKSTREEVER